MLGPREERVSTAVSTITSAMDMAQMVFSSASRQLLSNESPATVGVSMSTYGQARCMGQYLLRAVFKRNFLAVLTEPGDKKTDLANMLELVGPLHDLSVKTFELGRTPTSVPVEQYRRYVLQRVKSYRIKTIFLNIPDFTTVCSPSCLRKKTCSITMYCTFFRLTPFRWIE